MCVTIASGQCYGLDPRRGPITKTRRWCQQGRESRVFRMSRVGTPLAVARWPEADYRSEVDDDCLADAVSSLYRRMGLVVTPSTSDPGVLTTNR